MSFTAIFQENINNEHKVFICEVFTSSKTKVEITEDFELLTNKWIFDSKNLLTDILIKKRKAPLTEENEKFEYVDATRIIVIPDEDVLKIKEMISSFPEMKVQHKTINLKDKKIEYEEIKGLSPCQKKLIDIVPLIDQVKTQLPSTENVIKLQKEFSYFQMKKIMENASLYTRESISSCTYLSIDIINEYNNFKFDWDLVTNNCQITNRDILLNPDLPWNLSILDLEREDIPYSFFIYRKFKSIEHHNKNCTFTDVELLISQGEIKPEVLNSNINVDEIDVKEAYELLLSEDPELFEGYPEDFEDTSDSKAEDLKEKIRKVISTYGVFLIDDFNMIEEDKKNDEGEDFVNIFNKISKNFSSDKEKDLCNVVEYPITNRDEYLAYLELLTSNNLSPSVNLANCKFFELNDMLKYMTLFLDCMRNYLKEDNKSIISYKKDYEFDSMRTFLISKKILTVEFMNLTNNIFNWIKYSDFTDAFDTNFIFENLLFWQNRIKVLPNCCLNVTRFTTLRNFSTEFLISELEKFDEELMKYFITSKKSNIVHLTLQYPDIFVPTLKKIDSTNKYNMFKYTPYFFQKLFKKSDKELKMKDDIFSYSNIIYSFFTYEDLLSYEVLKKYLTIEQFELMSEEEKNAKVITLLKKDKKFREDNSYLIPDDIKRTIKLVKFEAPCNINFNELQKFFYEEFTGEKNLIDCYCYLSVNYHNNFLEDVLYNYAIYILIYGLKDESLDKSKLLNNFCLIYFSFKKSDKCDTSFVYFKLKELKELFNYFDLELIRNSEYPIAEEFFNNY